MRSDPVGVSVERLPNVNDAMFDANNQSISNSPNSGTNTNRRSNTG